MDSYGKERKGIIYKAINKTNGKIYVGQTIVGLKNRKIKHKSIAKKFNYHFAQAIKKYGIEGFNWKTIHKNISIEKLDEYEIFWIKKLDSYNAGYNSDEGGKSRRKFKHTEETKSKMSDNRKGKNNAMYGKKHTKETKEKMSKIKKGKKHTEESKKKMSENRKGKKFSEERKRKLPERRNVKLNWNKAKEIRRKYKIGRYTHKSLAQEYGVEESGICNIINNKKWIDENYIFSRLIKTKLNMEKAKEIRKKYKTGKFLYKVLAKEYGVSVSVICCVVNNKSWKENS